MRGRAGCDLLSDPDEIENLWNSPAVSEMQAQLMGYIAQWPEDARPNQVQAGMA